MTEVVDLRIARLPAGAPVVTVSIGDSRNAGLLAVPILASLDARLSSKLAAFKRRMAAESRAKNRKLSVS